MRFLEILLIAPVLVGVPLHASGDPAEEARELQTHALLINGGARPASNALSHLHHLQDMVEVLQLRGLPPDRIHVFSSDGSDPEADLAVRGTRDPRLWLVEGTGLGPPLRRAELTNTIWDDVTLRSATQSELRKWFARKSRELAAGDTLLVFVTDHGTQNKADPDNALISLWKESLSVLEFRALLAHLQPGVRVVSVMSQCYSGAFSQAMTPLNELTPSGDVCGFYSTTAERLAYGCYPEGRDRDRIGHAFHFIDAMKRNGTLDAAHRDVLVTDTTPDVPLRTSDLYLQQLLQEEADRLEVEPPQLVDELLHEAWRDRARWEPEIRLLDRLGSAYGVFSPRTIEEIETHIAGLEALSKQLETSKDRWKLALNDLRRDNLNQFLDANRELRERLDPKKVSGLAYAERKELADVLLPALESFSKERGEVWERLERLHAMMDDAQSAHYRVDIRLAALLRMQTLLVRIAAEHFLETPGTGSTTALEDAATAVSEIEACEAATIGVFDDVEPTGPLAFTPLPPYEEDLAVVERVLPSFFGINFRPVPAAMREEHELERGAVVVEQVYGESAAQAAGIRPGDLILGPPGEPFDEPRRIREWTMGAPRDEPVRLEVLRDGELAEVAVSLERYPAEMLRLPTPPGAGDDAPALPALQAVSGETESVERLVDRRHLLFFWATWCAPCKRSVPELLAWSKVSTVPVLAVSDEDTTKIQTFLNGWSKPFPERVFSDELRLSYLSYAVSGSPTFVLVDEHGTIVWRQTGYSASRGLEIEGWDWGP